MNIIRGNEFIVGRAVRVLIFIFKQKIKHHYFNVQRQFLTTDRKLRLHQTVAFVFSSLMNVFFCLHIDWTHTHIKL